MRPHYNNTAAKSVLANTIAPTASGILCPTVARTALFGFDVEVGDELVLAPVFPAAGEEVV
jgi:hypothetical protein